MWVYIKSWKPGVFTHSPDQAVNWDKCQNLVLLKGDERKSLGITNVYHSVCLQTTRRDCFSTPNSGRMSPVLLASPYPHNFCFPPAACFQGWLFSCINISALANLPAQSQCFSTSVLLVSSYWWSWWIGHSPSCPKPGVGCVHRGAAEAHGWAPDPATLPSAPLWPLPIPLDMSFPSAWFMLIFNQCQEVLNQTPCKHNE